MSADQVGEQEAVGLAQCQAQGIPEQLQVRANVPAERVQDVRAGPSGDQAVEDAPAIEAEDVAEHAPDADAAPVEDLLHPVAHPAALPDQRAPMADQIPQVAKRLVGHETGPSEPELTHPGQPAAVFDVGLAAAQLPHVLRVQQLRVDAGRGECAPRRLPVDAGPLQGRRLDAVAGQPSDQGVQAACQRTEGACLAGRFTTGRRTQPHRGRDLHLVHVESRGAGMDNVQVIVPHRFASCRGTGRGGGGAVGRTENSRPEGAVHFAARPRREAGYIAGLDADRPGQFSLGENVHHSAVTTTVLPPPLFCRGLHNGTEAIAGRSSISCLRGGEVGTHHDRLVQRLLSRTFDPRRSRPPSPNLRRPREARPPRGRTPRLRARRAARRLRPTDQFFSRSRRRRARRWFSPPSRDGCGAKTADRYRAGRSAPP